MKLDSFREPAHSRQLLEEIRKDLPASGIRIMEVCGTHTVELFRTGIREALRDIGVEFISGPGCPVCVTPAGVTDAAKSIAEMPNTMLITFGDMMRVPGSNGTLANARAEGAAVQVVYSPHEMLTLAEQHPETKFVFLAVGFETTLPTFAALLSEAKAKGIENILLLSAGKIVPPALEALFTAGSRNIDCLLLPGHVSTILGSDDLQFVPEALNLSAAIAGFEPVDMLLGVQALVRMMASGRIELANCYRRVVTPQGNQHAKDLLAQTFRPVDAEWRGLGVVPHSGMALHPDWASWDAQEMLGIEIPDVEEPEGCQCGSVLLGDINPPACPLFGGVCTPETAVGACMVSSEGSCAAWYKYGTQ